MACEQARQEYIDALNVYIRLEEGLRPLLLSYIGTEGTPGDPMVPGSEKFELVVRLTEERDQAFQRYRAAQGAFWEAGRAHLRGGS